MKKVLLLFVLVILCFPQIIYAECTNPPSGMTAWWTGDGTSEDHTGTNHGTLVNGATYTAGMAGQAFSFDGIDDYVTVPDNPSLRATTEFSIDFWAYFNQVPRTGNFNDSLTIVEKFNDYILYWRADLGGVLEMTFTDANDTLYHLGANTALASLTPGEWHHFAITAVNPAGIPTPEWHFYFDGVEQPYSLNQNPPDVSAGWFQGATGELHIGARSFPNLPQMPFVGAIDELEIFSRVLTTGEVQAIFQAGRDGKCKSLTTVPTLNQWGMIIFILFAGLGAAWRVRCLC